MSASIRNIINNLYNLGLNAPSESELLEDHYKKSRKAARDFALQKCHEEALFYKPLSEAQKIEFLFLKAKEEKATEDKYSSVDIFLNRVGSVFIEETIPEKRELQYQLDQLWMILHNSPTDAEIKIAYATDDVEFLTLKNNRDILDNETKRLYKSLTTSFPDLKKPRECSFKPGTFLPLCCPIADKVRNRANIQLQYNKDVGFAVTIAVISTASIVALYAVHYFQKK
ncbi:MAG: hypothetical protein V4489_00745 [Chlamydiota bacterium]